MYLCISLLYQGYHCKELEYTFVYILFMCILLYINVIGVHTNMFITFITYYSVFQIMYLCLIYTHVITNIISSIKVLIHHNMHRYCCLMYHICLFAEPVANNTYELPNRMTYWTLNVTWKCVFCNRMVSGHATRNCPLKQGLPDVEETNIWEWFNKWGWDNRLGWQTRSWCRKFLISITYTIFKLTAWDILCFRSIFPYSFGPFDLTVNFWLLFHTLL